MIKSKTHNITLAFSEVTALEEHLGARGKNLETFTNGASYSASPHGVMIHCTSERQANNVWCAVLAAAEQ